MAMSIRFVRSERVPKAMKPLYDKIIRRTDAYCKTYLDSEYAQVCRWMTAALARKKDPILRSEGVSLWAAAIICSVGMSNITVDPERASEVTPDRLAGSMILNKDDILERMQLIGRSFDNAYTPALAWVLPSLLKFHPTWSCLQGFLHRIRS